jgi:hypothetical protein
MRKHEPDRALALTRIVLALAVLEACTPGPDASAPQKEGRADDTKQVGPDVMRHGDELVGVPPPPKAQPAAGAPAPAKVAFAEKAPVIEETPAPAAADRAPEPEEKHVQSRAWFPETFLFEPLVVTDGDGAASLKLRVPDRLTTWRVLALAHSRGGAQAGAVARFLGTLPTYVDPVVPPFLLVGDEVRLPVQVVNTTAAPVAAELRLAAEGAALTPARVAIAVPAAGSVVAYATLRAQRPGPVSLRAALGATDAVVRTIPILPAGRRVVVARSGTLAAPRALSLDTPAGADPASGEARLQVFPGALALVRTELAGSLARGGVAEDAYTLYLAGNAARLLAAFGDAADPAVVRDLALVAGQRTLRHARTLDTPTATLIAAAALAHPDNPVLARLGERAAATLAAGQRPDGTFAGATGWTLQRLLVATAEGTRAVQAAAGTPAGRQRAAGVALRAQGAFERNLDHVEDGYTAAAILASGALTGDLAEKLRAKVRAGVVRRGEGARALEVGEGVVRADGAVPSEVEATALAVLALPGADDAALRADLGTTLLGGYGPGPGWGDGRANLVCLAATLALFKEPIPPGVKVTLLLDGKPVADGALDRDRLREVLTLVAPAPAGGTHAWRLVADPPVPGLGYAFTVTSYVPWDREPPRGLELSIVAPADARAGRRVTVALRATAPSGEPLHIVHALPAGVQPDQASLDKLVQDGVLSSWLAADGKVELSAPALEPGATFAAAYGVIPTLAGTLHAPASSIAAAGETVLVPPAPWTVR